jgi:hypothetical protein
LQIFLEARQGSQRDLDGSQGKIVCHARYLSPPALLDESPCQVRPKDDNDYRILPRALRL